MGIDLLCLGNIVRDVEEYEGLKAKSQDEIWSSHLSEDVNKKRQIPCTPYMYFHFSFPSFTYIQLNFDPSGWNDQF